MDKKPRIRTLTAEQLEQVAGGQQRPGQERALDVERNRLDFRGTYNGRRYSSGTPYCTLEVYPGDRRQKPDGSYGLTEGQLSDLRLCINNHLRQ